MRPILTAATALVALPLCGLAQPAPTSVPPITVTAPAERDQVGPVTGYQALTTGAATRTATPLNEVPQSVQIIPRRLIEEQGTVRLEDALRNAAGVQPNSAYLFNQTFGTRIRGFLGEVVRDGLSSFFDAGLPQSLTGVERIEILKGPTAALFGGGYGGGLGGTINIVSRLPSPITAYETGLRIGPYGQRAGYLDVNQAAGSIAEDGTQAMVRLQAEFTHGRSAIENFAEDGYAITPAVTLRTDRTTLTLQGSFSERRTNEYTGLPVVGTLDTSRFAFDRYRNPNGGNVPRTVSTRNAVTTLFEHRIDDTWTLRFAGRLSASNLEEPAQTLFGAPLGSLFPRVNVYLQQDLTQVSMLPMLEGRFTTGAVRHTFLAGAEFDTVTDRGRLGFAFSDIYNPLAPATAPFVLPALFGTNTQNRYTTYAAFVQNQATLWERLHLLAALRATQIEIISQTPEGNGFTATTTRLTPRLGLAYDVVQGVTLFGGWGTGIRANPYVTLASGTPKPEESEQWEAGLKLNLPFGLSGTVAYFDITRRNVAVSDPGVLFAQRQSGEQRSRGVEFDLLWQPDPHISVLASYAHIQAEITEDTTIARGTRLPFVPRNAARLWAAYRVLERGPAWLAGLTIGAGLQSTAGAPLDTVGTRGPRGYTTYDAQLSYQAGPARVALTGRNLGDTRYFVPFEYLGGAVAPASGREVTLTAALRF